MKNSVYSTNATIRTTSPFCTRSDDHDTCEFRERLETWGIYDQEAEYVAFRDMAEEEVKSDNMVFFRKAS